MNRYGCCLSLVATALSLSVPDVTAGECPIFPANNIWNFRVDRLPTDARSADYIRSIGPNVGLHPDFGSGTWDGGPIGIPYTTVPGNQPKVPVAFDYNDESDPGPYPIPLNPPIEYGSDHHLLIVDSDHCVLYELWDTSQQANGGWRAGSGAIFDLRSNALRPAGWTSADAAGLPILPGLARCEELAAGSIHHALRFTAQRTRREYVWPARHYASSITDPGVPTMGQRFRLKTDFALSGYSPQTQVILIALKTYGMMLADNGSNGYISGAPGTCWDDETLVSELRTVTIANFEAVDVSGLMVHPDSAQVRVNDTSTSPILFSGDYNGDGKADLIWRNSNTGQVYGMLLDGIRIAQQGMVYAEPNPTWQIVQNGDFDGDGKSDLLWWNSSTGQVYLMPMNGLGLASGGAVIHQEPNTAWQMVAVGDLNGDKSSDLIWWNSITGQVYGMFMNDGVITQDGMIYQEANTSWRILAARDFTGDGKADLLWRNLSTGQVYLMPMNGLSIAGGAMVYQEPNLAWSIVAVGDLNHDQRADLIWWNSQTGQVYGMLMDGPIIAQGGMIYQEPNNAWTIIASGDYTGDGQADLLWRNSATGQIYEMAMNGLSITGGAVIHQEANANWRIVADANTPRLPVKALAGPSRFAPLSGKPLNSPAPLNSAPVNPHQPMDGEPLHPYPSLTELVPTAP